MASVLVACFLGVFTGDVRRFEEVVIIPASLMMAVTLFFMMSMLVLPLCGMFPPGIPSVSPVDPLEPVLFVAATLISSLGGEPRSDEVVKVALLFATRAVSGSAVIDSFCLT